MPQRDYRDIVEVVPRASKAHGARLPDEKQKTEADDKEEHADLVELVERAQGGDPSVLPPSLAALKRREQDS